MPVRNKKQPLKRVTKKPYDPSPRDLEIYERLCCGDSLREVASKFRLGKSTVAVIRDKVEAYLNPKFEKEIRQVKTRQTTVLNKLLREVLDAWDKSRDGESVEDKSGEKGYSKTVPLGDVAYFDRAVSAMSEVRKIWNIEKHFEMAGQEALNPAGMPRDEYRRKVAETQIAELQELVAELQGKGETVQ